MDDILAQSETADQPYEIVTFSVQIRDSLGLHARPAARLAQEALRHQARITLRCDGLSADAKSILDILSLAAGRGSTLEVICAGSDAREAADALERMFQSHLLGSAE